MEGERKKRKIALQEDGGRDEDSEDVKMEKFFALIRSAKDIRDRLLDADESRPPKNNPPAAEAENHRCRPVQDLAENRNISRTSPAAEERGNIRPSFRRIEDLAENLEASKPALFRNQQMANCACASASASASASARRLEEEHEQKADEGNDDNNKHFRGRRFEIDLNLSL